MALGGRTVRDITGSISLVRQEIDTFDYAVLGDVIDDLDGLVNAATKQGRIQIPTIVDILNDVTDIESYRLARDIESVAKEALDDLSIHMSVLVTDCLMSAAKEIEREKGE